MHVVKKQTNFHVDNMFVFLLDGVAEDVQESAGDADGKCINAKTTTNTLITSAYGLTNNGTV